jgi:hypothetical protein
MAATMPTSKSLILESSIAKHKVAYWVPPIPGLPFRKASKSILIGELNSTWK